MISRALAGGRQQEAYGRLLRYTMVHHLPRGFAGKALAILAATEAKERLALWNRPSVSKLTAREREILADAARGFTSQETGRHLYLATETVKGYRRNMMAKLGARNITHAVGMALERHGIDLEEEN